jgi:hypothetical protein
MRSVPFRKKFFFEKKSDLSILREVDLLRQFWRLATHEPLYIEQYIELKKKRKIYAKKP